MDTSTVQTWLTNKPLAAFDFLVREAKLTEREEMVIRKRCAEGRKCYQIAMDLDVSPETVKLDLRSACAKINAAIYLIRTFVL